MRIPIARYLSILFIAAIIGFAAQFVIVVATTAVTYPNALTYVIGTGQIIGLLALSTVLIWGLVYAVSRCLRSTLSRRKARIAFAVSGAIGPAIPYLYFCTGHHLMRCGFENARNAVLSLGNIVSGAVFGFVFFTIFWNFLHPRRDAP